MMARAQPGPGESAGSTVQLSIGQLSTRTGIDSRTLRAWERRYGLFQPSREANGYRRYGQDDVDRATLMRRLTQQGTRASMAAGQILTLMPHPAEPVAPSRTGSRAAATRQLRDDLISAIEALDAERADAVFEEAVLLLAEEELIAKVISPAMRRSVRRQSSPRLPERVQAYFAAGIVRGGLGRLLARYSGRGPELWFACPTDEQHEIGLLCLAVLAGKGGWNPVYFGAHTPLNSVSAAAQVRRPAGVVIGCTRSVVVRTHARELQLLARTVPTAVGGPGAIRAFIDGTGAGYLPDDVVSAVDELPRVLGVPAPQPLLP
ncbi:MAG: MerR family transcriptional regulator [Austwickia sp.]|jgi:DNA-binding transcriptional MerR regulator|nr:MerR family transcriptional regulator [Austwickia sp.]MBK8435340.1 MerR family transcriptional regulator [Austwickia sp.]MBK9101111.1 MerR family transcriptional regulator [Austwickia sp.]